VCVKGKTQNRLTPENTKQSTTNKKNNHPNMPIQKYVPCARALIMVLQMLAQMFLAEEKKNEKVQIFFVVKYL